MSLKGFFRKTVKDVYRREGVPPIIDKTFNNIWDAFMKTQPRILSTSNTASAAGLLVDSDLWGILQRCMERYGVNPKIATKVIRLCKRRFGENLSPAKIKILLW